MHVSFYLFLSLDHYPLGKSLRAQMIQPDCLAIVTPAALSQKMLDAICNIKIKHPKFKKKKNTVIVLYCNTVT